jgi:hypothetical protein
MERTEQHQIVEMSIVAPLDGMSRSDKHENCSLGSATGGPRARKSNFLHYRGQQADCAVRAAGRREVPPPEPSQRCTRAINASESPQEGVIRRLEDPPYAPTNKSKRLSEADSNSSSWTPK